MDTEPIFFHFLYLCEYGLYGLYIIIEFRGCFTLRKDAFDRGAKISLPVSYNQGFLV